MGNLFFTVGAKCQHYGKNLRGCTFDLIHEIMFFVLFNCSTMNTQQVEYFWNFKPCGL